MNRARRIIVVAIVGWLLASGWSAERTAAQTFGPAPTTKPAPATAAAASQFGAAAANLGSQLGSLHTSRYQIGVVVTPQGGPCTEIIAAVPVPIEWPEQTVSVVKEDVTPTVSKIEYRMFNGTAKQMLAFMPLVPPGDEARAVLTFEIKRHSQTPPADTAQFVLPNDKKLSREMRQYLLPSPYIESAHLKIKAASKELMTKHQADPAWQKVEAIYDWVREKVTYVNGPLKGALKALEDGSGDCEELSSLFIAVCRASNVPARIVWVPGHCYPEFYLEDEAGRGYWFPCQAAGTREFGGITEQRPILQKGDNFLIPELPVKRQRYVVEYVTGKSGNPKFRAVQQPVAAE